MAGERGRWLGEGDEPSRIWSCREMQSTLDKSSDMSFSSFSMRLLFSSRFDLCLSLSMCLLRTSCASLWVRRTGRDRSASMSSGPAKLTE